LQIFDKKQALTEAEIEAHAKLQEVAELAKLTKTLGRDADAFQQAVEPMTDGSVYIGAKQFAEAAAAAGIEPAQAALTSRAVAEQFESALAEGRDMEVPVAEFAAMQGQPFAATLLDHIRLRADGPTKAELTAAANDADGLKTEVEAAVRDVLAPTEDQKFQASKERVLNAEVTKMAELGRLTRSRTSSMPLERRPSTRNRREDSASRRRKCSSATRSSSPERAAPPRRWRKVRQSKGGQKGNNNGARRWSNWRNAWAEDHS
jgi:hypothetical protein